MSVRNIGKGYYAIDSEGVTIADHVHRAFEDAFKKVSRNSSKKLRVRLAPESMRNLVVRTVEANEEQK